MTDQSIEQIMNKEDYYIRYIASKYKIESYDIEDLEQEARMVLFNILKHDKHDPTKSKLSTFLLASIDHHFKNLYASQNQQSMLHYQVGVEGFGSRIDKAVNVKFEHCKYYDEIYKILDGNFNAKLTTIIKMKLDGHSLEEIAKHMNNENGTTISKQTVDIMLKRSLQPMYHLLKKQGVLDE